MMVSIQQPPKRKLESLDNSQVKRLRGSESSINHADPDTFSEKMYLAFVKSALDGLEVNDSNQMDILASKLRLPRSNKDSISLPSFTATLRVLISNISKLDNKRCNGLIMAIIEFPWMTQTQPLSKLTMVLDQGTFRIEEGEEGEEKEGELGEEKNEGTERKEEENESNNQQLPSISADRIAFNELYLHFLSVLVSSLPKYLHDVIKKLVSEFVEDNIHQFKHHEILCNILKYIPTSVNSLPAMLQKHFPHHLASNTSSLTNYVTNLIKILSYCPELQYDIWQMIFESCIKLDVELQNELDDLDDDEIEELINGNDEDDEDEVPGESDPEDVNMSTHNNEGESDSDNDSDDDERHGEEEYLIDNITSTTTIKKILTKLDSIIKLLLHSTEGSFTVQELNDGNGVFLFNTITSLFKSHILPTHFTKLIQFTLFHISQYQPELSDSFLVLLIDVAFSSNEIIEKRVKAMQYLSSYIARARNLSRHQIVFVVSYLIGWLNKFVIERECEVFDVASDNKGRINNDPRSNHSLMKKPAGGMERFKLFYAAFQALLYIFCFRHKMLYKVTPGLNDKDGGEVDSATTSSIDPSGLNSINSDSEWECELDKFFQRMMITKFNPLKYCDETVVYIFAKISTKLNVCYCYSIIEHNKRERMIQTSAGSSYLPSAVTNFKQKQEFLDLEAYFPFDPLVLPFCKKIISANYIEWADVNPNNDDDDDDEDSGSHPEMDSDDEEITSEEEDDL